MKYVKIHLYGSLNRALTHDFGVFYYGFPEIPILEMPANGIIINDGTPTALYTSWITHTHNELNSAPSYRNESWGAGGLPSPTFDFHFPNVNTYNITSPEFNGMIAVNETNGRAMIEGGGSPCWCYAYDNISDCLADVNYRARGSEQYRQGSLWWNRSNHSSVTLFGYYMDGDTLKFNATRLTDINKTTISLERIAIDNPAYTFFYSDMSEDIPTDPYGPGGHSGTGGGTGTFGGTGDIIGVPTIPTLSAVETGFITLFKPTLSELNGLANYLWGNLFDISTWKKVFADPMDAILGLSIVPVNPSTSGSANIVVGNIQTSISMPKISSQYVEVDCGTLNIEEYWGAYLDYSPYTKFELYLPYIGTHPISADDIMGDTISVVYHVDVLSGACVAYVQCGGTVIYTFVGQCSSSIPITGNDWTNVINGTLSIAGAIGSMVATGGATAPMAIGGIASTVTNCIKPEIEKSGAMSGTGGMLGVQTPYLIVTRPKQCVAKNQNKMIGYPSHIYKPLTDVVGYTEILSIHLQGVAATDDELTEIVSLLQNGVIF